MKLKTEPRWVAAATFVAYFYTVWIMQLLYADMSKGGGGQGIMVFYFISLLAFPLILVLISIAINFLLNQLDNMLLRTGIIVLGIAVFFSLHDLGVLAIVIGAAIAVYMYFQTKKSSDDQRDLENFE